MSFPEARNRAITDALASDSRTILIGDLGGPGEPEGGYAKAFGPKRAREGPVSEESLGGAAVGAALMGLRPIVTFANAGFMFDAWEPVMDEAAFMRYMSGGQYSVPAVFHVMVGIRTGWAAQHAQVPQAMFCNAPGLVVVAPGTPAAAYELMRAAAASDDPVIYVDPRPLHSDVGEVQANGEIRPVRAKVLRSGNDITVVAVSTMVPRALRVADKLAGEGISVEVVDPMVLSPLDREGILASVRRTGRLIAADEGQLTCGVASEIVASVVERGMSALKAPPRRLAIPDIPAAPNPAYWEAVGPSEARLEETVRAVLAE
jgi:pyruvate dehydrogenase E1 component beta subunit